MAVAMIGFVVVLTVTLWITNKRLDHAQTKLGTVKTELAQSLALAKSIRAQARATNLANLQTIAECQAVNAENAAQRENVKLRADTAIAKAREYEKQLKTQEARYEALSTQLLTLDGPLPDDLVGWLCGPGANCADRNKNSDAGPGSYRAGSSGTDAARTGPAVSTRRLAEVYRSTVNSLMVCNDRLGQIAGLVQ